jgi:hypothetical protein
MFTTFFMGFFLLTVKHLLSSKRHHTHSNESGKSHWARNGSQEFHDPSGAMEITQVEEERYL